MKILALDPATKCGWAHSDGPSGTWDLKVRADESDGMRLIRLRAKLSEIKRDVGFELLVFEASRNLQYGNAIRVAGELQGVVKLWATDNKVDYRAYSSKEIKKFATGKGNANKDAMLEAAAKYWDAVARNGALVRGDDNEIDALWLLDLAMREYGQSASRLASA